MLLVDTARYPLRVRAIHRLLHGLPVADALAALHGLFRVRRVDAPLPDAMEVLAEAACAGNAFLLAGDGTFHLVDRPDPDLLARTVPGDRPAAWRTLDATVLHSTLLKQVWRIPEDSRPISPTFTTRPRPSRRRNATAVRRYCCTRSVRRSSATSPARA
ncbi:hypothetical protein ACR6C2_10980 [Streptomyces sp. INA 01156]